MYKVDLNSDLGESFGAYTIGMDEAVIAHISSANVACGYHAGDPLVMDKTIAAARAAGVAVGAHPGYPDLIGFGRRNMACSPKEVKAYVKYQLGAMMAFAASNGVKVQHCKPHGSMYNMAAKDMDLMERPMEEETGEILSALLRQYYAGRSRLPRQILLPCELDDQVPLTRMLSEQAGRRVELITPQRGAKMDLIKLANQNAVEEVTRATTREERQNKLLEALGKMLGLEQAPRRTESYDISNTGADDMVASMVVFENGRPLKRDYRRFKIKDLTGPDDYASMEQVLTRRFQRYLDGDEKFGNLPDLMLIDGGENHVKIARRVLDDFGLDIPAFGMVKDDRHRTRALVAPDGREIGIQAIPAVFALIGQIQEETHRFAIEFNRQQRKGRVQGSALDKIPGVGEKRRAQLLKAFKSVKAIRQAPLEELEKVVPKNTAQAVYQFFRREETKD